MKLSVGENRYSRVEFWKECDELLIPMRPDDIKNTEENECIICFHPFVFENNDTEETPIKIVCACKTAFYHKGCIIEWFKKQPSCPVCRADMRLKSDITI